MRRNTLSAAVFAFACLIMIYAFVSEPTAPPLAKQSAASRVAGGAEAGVQAVSVGALASSQATSATSILPYRANPAEHSRVKPTSVD